MKINMLTLLTGAALAFTISSPAFAGDHDGGDHKEKRGGHHGKMFERLDGNGDGSISEAEFVAAHKEKFSKMDANGDGSITKAEAEAAKEKWKSKRKEMGADRKGKKGSAE